MDTPLIETATDAPATHARASVPIAVREEWLQLDGVRYSCRVQRHPCPEFEPTLFLSGAFQTMDSWARFAKAFAPFTTVVLVDPPGMGQADLLAPEFGLDFLARAIRRVLDSVGLQRINIVAASYGTPAAYRFAQLHGERVDHIVLGGTMREIPGHIRERVRQSVEIARTGDRERLADEVVDGLLCRDPRLAVDRRALAERVLRGGLLRMSEAQLQQYAANTTRLLDHEPLDLDTPVRGPEALVFTGEHDGFTVPDDCRRVAQAFDRSWFTTVRRADHLFHIEQFDAVCGLLLRFMSGQLGDSAPGCHSIAETGGRVRRPTARSRLGD